MMYFFNSTTTITIKFATHNYVREIFNGKNEFQIKRHWLNIKGH